MEGEKTSWCRHKADTIEAHGPNVSLIVPECPVNLLINDVSEPHPGFPFLLSLPLPPNSKEVKKDPPGGQEEKTSMMSGICDGPLVDLL